MSVPLPTQKVEPFDQPGSLMTITLTKLAERDLFEVFTDTKIPFFWLRKFASNTFKNPSVNRVQYLYEYLTGKTLV